jgi:RNA polymerase sigma factor (sigma-70 family)
MTAIDRPDLDAANDAGLERLLRAGGGVAAEREIERLIVGVRPVVAAILARYARSRTRLSAEDAADLAGSIDLLLLERLRCVARAEESIHDFRAYVARLTYNAASDFLRRRFPERAQWKNRIRYVLSRDPRLALWNSEAGVVGGLAGWKGDGDALDDVPAGVTTVSPYVADREGQANALVEIFFAVRRPLVLDALVDFLSEAWQVGRTPLPPASLDELAAPDPDVGSQLEQRDFIRALWDEIVQLRPMQRKALLLNLRYDGDLDILSALLLSGAATFEGLAAALEWTTGELLAIWKDLPLDDLRIAAMLQITRQQVINLRKSARERLARRLRR